MSDFTIARKKISGEIISLNAGKTLDNNNAHLMVDAITESQASGYNFIIIDMSELEFLSSAGVGSILGTVEESRERGGDIIICNVSPTIMQIFNVLDLSDYLTIKTDRAAAMEFSGLRG